MFRRIDIIREINYSAVSGIVTDIPESFFVFCIITSYIHLIFVLRDFLRSQKNDTASVCERLS